MLRSGAELAGAWVLVLAMYVGPALLVARVGVQLDLSYKADLLLLFPVYGVVFAVFERYDKAAGVAAAAAERREWQAARLVVEEERAAEVAIADEPRHRPTFDHPAAIDTGRLYLAASCDELTVKSWSPGDYVVIAENQASMTNVDTDENASVRVAFEEIDRDCDGLHTLESISYDGSIVTLDDGSLWHVAGPDPTIVSWSRWYPAEGD